MVHNRKHIKIKTDTEWYYWLGFYLGDGWSQVNTDTGKGNVSFFLSLKDDYQRCYNYFSSLGLNVRISCPLNKKMVSVSITSMSLALAFKHYYPGHQIATTKRVPAQVWSACLSLRNSFLKGILDSDGYVSNNTNSGVAVHLANQSLIQELYLLFHDSGIPVSIVQSSPNSWRLQLHRWYVLKYLDKGPVGNYSKPRHGKKIPAFLQRQAILDFNKVTNVESCDKPIMYRLRAGKSVSPYTLKYLYSKYNVTATLPVYDFFALKEKEILDEEEDTYTLQVKSPLHRFDAETVINKNTSADIQKLAMSLMFEQLYSDGYSPTQSNDVRQLCTIHDEIVSESLPSLSEYTRTLQQNSMENAAKQVLSVCPVEAEAHTIPNLAAK